MAEAARKYAAAAARARAQPALPRYTDAAPSGAADGDDAAAAYVPASLDGGPAGGNRANASFVAPPPARASSAAAVASSEVTTSDGCDDHSYCEFCLPNFWCMYIVNYEVCMT